MEEEKILVDEKKAKYRELADFIASKNADPHELIAVLHKAQALFGYLPEEVQRFVAMKLGLPVAKVYSVVSFYSFFTMKKAGKYVIRVCMGTACFVRGSEQILKEFEKVLAIKEGETTTDGLYTLETVRCVGACGLAPVVQVNGKTYGNCTLESVKQILEENR